MDTQLFITKEIVLIRKMSSFPEGKKYVFHQIAGFADVSSLEKYLFVRGSTVVSCNRILSLLVTFPSFCIITYITCMYMYVYTFVYIMYNIIMPQDQEDNCSTTAFVDDILIATMKQMVEEYQV